MKRYVPFSAPHYRLSSCSLGVLDNRNNARLISGRLAKMDPWGSLGYSSEGILDYLLRHDSGLSRYTVSLKDEKIGVLCIRYPWLRGPYIEMIGLFEAYQNRGIGGEIIGWVEKQAETTSRNLWVLVSAFNKRAFHFYVKQGFMKTASIPDLIKSGCDEILFRKVVQGSQQPEIQT